MAVDNSVEKWEGDHVLPSWLTQRMSDVLIEHIDGPQAVDVRSSSRPTVVAMVGRELLTYDEESTRFVVRPKQTFLTHLGRSTLAAMLATHADALARAQRSDDDELLAALQSATSKSVAA